MKRLVEYPLEDGSSVIVEVSEADVEGVARAGRAGEVIEKATQTFESALKKVKPAALAALSMMRELGDSPDEVGVEFGVKLGAKAGILRAFSVQRDSK